ncbi:MAG: DNA-binding protein [Deltaproteobacteria bacterium]|nr:MAG: DNA-binding protein [Deltaproteobacteria bacterium]
METRRRAGAAHASGLRVVHDRARSLLTVAEVANRLKVSRATVYRLVKDGDLPSVRVSNSIRVRGGDLDAYVARSSR